MNKRIGLALAIGSIVTAIVTAQAVTGGGWQRDDMEEIELSGRLRLVEDERPVLVSNGTDYILAIHPVLSGEVSVGNGQQVTVEGFAVSVPSPDLLGEDHLVRVTAMEVDGTRVVMPAGGPGMAGGWGRHGGPMMQHGYGARPGFDRSPGWGELDGVPDGRGFSGPGRR